MVIMPYIIIAGFGYKQWFFNILYHDSRLWDAVGGFLFLFSHMQDKLSKHASQVDLLKELLNLQKDMITMMLSMLEGMLELFTVKPRVSNLCITDSS